MWLNVLVLQARDPINRHRCFLRRSLTVGWYFKFTVVTNDGSSAKVSAVAKGQSTEISKLVNAVKILRI